MAIEIVVPRSGWSMEEGTFAGWLKAAGELVKPGDKLFALESDKSIEEAESMDGGILALPPGAPKQGDRVKVGQLLGYLLQPGESLPGAAVEASAVPAAPPPPVVSAPPAASRAPAELGADIGGDAMPRPAPTPGRASIPVTPRARRAARELNVDLQQVSGSGFAGRIRERDVTAAAQPRRSEPAPAGGAIPITSLRRTIAERMRRSQSETAPVTLTSRFDATNLVGLRNQFKATATGDAPAIPSYTDIVAKLCAHALRRHPLLAGRWESDSIRLAPAMNIGIAVDTEAGLMVPVVRDVDTLTLTAVTRRTRELVDAARQRRIRAEDLQGGVFTITNLGAFGIDAFTPIINFPEAAILGLGAIRREAVVLPDGGFGSREVMTLSLTFDHRIVDGAPAARFVQTLVQGLENPAAWLLDLQ